MININAFKKFICNDKWMLAIKPAYE